MAKPSKYRNIRTTVDGITFASKKEAARYSTLKIRESARMISNLKLQPRFDCVVKGKKICTYVADFYYWDVLSRQFRIEDSKGYRTAIYKLKKKLVEALHNVVIEEV